MWGWTGADSWSEENKARFHFLSKLQGQLAYSSFCSLSKLSTMSRLTGFDPGCVFFVEVFLRGLFFFTLHSFF